MKLNFESADDVVFFCIGTDKSTGDSFGPLVGLKLKELGYNVIGCIHEPVHALNMEERVKEIPEGKTVIAIDACICEEESYGDVTIGVGGIRPGIGVGKKINTVGDICIKGMVLVGLPGHSNLNSMRLNTVRLSLVFKMVDDCVNKIENMFKTTEELMYG